LGALLIAFGIAALGSIFIVCKIGPLKAVNRDSSRRER
jgi:hypothetical protein